MLCCTNKCFFATVSKIPRKRASETTHEKAIENSKFYNEKYYICYNRNLNISINSFRLPIIQIHDLYSEYASCELYDICPISA